LKKETLEIKSKKTISKSKKKHNLIKKAK